MCNTGGRSSGLKSLQNLLSQTGEIRLDDLKKAIDGNQWRVNNKPPKGSATQKDPEQIKNEALKMYAAYKSKEVHYSPGSHNCEHFAQFIRHGIAHSEQVTKKS